MIDLADAVRQVRESGIRAIVFDLDGTLYANIAFSREIARSFARYIGALKGIDEEAALSLVKETRAELSAASGLEAPLSAACIKLGGDLKEVHRHMAGEIAPERFLARDDRVIELLKRLKARYDLLLYTNNNRSLTGRIVAILGFEELFREIVTIEDGWRAKPASSVLDRVLALAGVPPGECLFVGDRYDIDLRLPALRGCPVLLVTSVEELLQLAPLTEP